MTPRRAHQKWPLIVICLLPGCGSGNRGFCSRTELETHSMRGVTFQTARTDCDVIGKDSLESITARDSSGRKEVVFSFDPDERSSRPQISLAGGRLLISLTSASSIYREEKQFGSLGIDYQIGHVEYPSNAP